VLHYLNHSYDDPIHAPLHYAFLQERRFDDAKQQLDACRRMAANQFSDHADPDMAI
jgi:hypothetical protein